jgi:hypothetical protein
MPKRNLDSCWYHQTAKGPLLELWRDIPQESESKTSLPIASCIFTAHLLTTCRISGYRGRTVEAKLEGDWNQVQSKNLLFEPDRETLRQFELDVESSLVECCANIALRVHNYSYAATFLGKDLEIGTALVVLPIFYPPDPLLHVHIIIYYCLRCRNVCYAPIPFFLLTVVVVAGLCAVDITVLVSCHTMTARLPVLTELYIPPRWKSTFHKWNQVRGKHPSVRYQWHKCRQPVIFEIKQHWKRSWKRSYPWRHGRICP